MVELFHSEHPEWAAPEALAVTALLHVSSEADRLTNGVELLKPRLILFLDEHSWALSGLQLTRTMHHIADPHRAGQVYEGFWGKADDGRVVGKSPQHPTTHNLYRADEMMEFLRAAPKPS